jgi:hypothetical protein
MPDRIYKLRRSTTLLLFCQAAALVLLLAACSRIQLAYNNLDWLLPRYLASYMPLSDDQDDLLEMRVNHFLHWHCSTQVGVYAQLLREASSRFQSGALTRAELVAFNNRVEQAWAGILHQAAPAIADILVTADEDQVQALFEGFDKRNTEWLEDFEETSEEELRRGYRSRMSKELRRWFGRLDRRQQQALDEWSERFQPLGLEGLHYRQRWQARLHEIVDNRGDRKRFYRDFAELLNDPVSLRTPRYRQRIVHNRDATIDMLYTVIRNLGEQQKHHLQKQVKSVAGDFDSLACGVETVASSWGG